MLTEGEAKTTHGGFRFVKGELVQRVEYTPFGKERLVLNSALEELPKYTGQTDDVETDLYYYGSRYYDSVLGRFIQPDSIIPDAYSSQALNSYAYVLGNPLRYVDPLGYSAKDYYDDYGRLNEKEKEVALRNPIDAYYVYQTEQEAASEAKRRFPQGGWRDEGDAFRHTYWNAMMAREIGVEAAEEFANAHESVPIGTFLKMKPDQLADMAMDFYNNNIGRQIGSNPANADKDLAALVQQALEEDQLQTSLQPKEVKQNENQNMPDKATGTVTMPNHDRN